MTVKELKDKINSFPDDMEVLVSVHGSNCGFSETFGFHDIDNQIF